MCVHVVGAGCVCVWRGYPGGGGVMEVVLGADEKTTSKHVFKWNQ